MQGCGGGGGGWVGGWGVCQAGFSPWRNFPSSSTKGVLRGAFKMCPMFPSFLLGRRRCLPVKFCSTSLGLIFVSSVIISDVSYQAKNLFAKDTN